MTKVLLLSDTHGCIDDFILKHVAWADEVWHAGDIGNREVVDKIRSFKPLRAVYGNIDGTEIRQEFPLDNLFEVEGKKIWMTHIGGYPGKYESRVKKELVHRQTDIFISGHSHILKVIYDHKNDLLHMNPGAAGKSGFHTMRTMLRFVLDQGEIREMEIVEIKK